MKGSENMENNENPNYVLKFNETVLKTVKDINYKIKKAVMIIVGIIILASIIFQNNFFSDLNWITKIMLLSLVLGVMFTGKNEKIKSPIEIKFYDDYLLVYREKRYYTDRVSRKEYNKFLYKDITECDYNNNTKRFDIIGKIEAIWYDYNKNGTIPNNPTYNRVVDGGICYFYTDLEPELDIVKQFEEHSQIKVTIK